MEAEEVAARLAPVVAVPRARPAVRDRVRPVARPVHMPAVVADRTAAPPAAMWDLPEELQVVQVVLVLRQASGRLVGRQVVAAAAAVALVVAARAELLEEPGVVTVVLDMAATCRSSIREEVYRLQAIFEPSALPGRRAQWESARPVKFPYPAISAQIAVRRPATYLYLPVRPAMPLQ